jgi:hypothetical protein
MLLQIKRLCRTKKPSVNRSIVLATFWYSVPNPPLFLFQKPEEISSTPHHHNFITKHHITFGIQIRDRANKLALQLAKLRSTEHRRSSRVEVGTDKE